MNLEVVLILVLVGFTATYVWRLLAVLLMEQVDPKAPWILWVELVGYGLIAALVSRVVIMPTGALAETPLMLRLFAVGLAVGLARFTPLSNLPAISCSALAFALGLLLF